MNRAARRKQQRQADKVRYTLAQGISRYEALKLIDITRSRSPWARFWRWLNERVG